jgi:hypothetical protein
VLNTKLRKNQARGGKERRREGRPKKRKRKGILGIISEHI